MPPPVRGWRRPCRSGSACRAWTSAVSIRRNRPSWSRTRQGRGRPSLLSFFEGEGATCRRASENGVQGSPAFIAEHLGRRYPEIQTVPMHAFLLRACDGGGPPLARCGVDAGSVPAGGG